MTSSSPILPPIQTIDSRQPARTASLPPHLPPIEVGHSLPFTDASIPPSFQSSTVESSALPATMPPSANQQNIGFHSQGGSGNEMFDMEDVGNERVGGDGLGEPDDEEDGDDDDDEDEDGDHSSENEGEHQSVHPGEPYPWKDIQEDTTVPCADEIAFIESKEEHSAVDHEYWEKKTFFDLNDPELLPGSAGRIDWLVTGFNGTQQKPNTQLVMKSPCVDIGGYLWQIKLYPKGNNTDFLSVYVECVTMQKPGFVHSKDFEQLPFPTAKGAQPLKKRVSIAAQLSVVMYNPAEPRVHEHKNDAHQFHEHAADFGWKYFTREPRQVFHRRKHGQRQAILKDDCLAFSAYIRIVHDPTGCLWQTSWQGPDVSVATTGLRPFDGASAQIATIVMLLHLQPFRLWLETTKQTSPVVSLLQIVLHKALHRKLKKKHLKYLGLPDGCDVIAVLNGIRAMLRKHDSNAAETGLDRLLTELTSDKQRIAHQRLPTRYWTSIQQAVHESKPSAAPRILLIELERQFFDSKKRKWEKVKNAVDIDDQLEYNGTQYYLYGVVTHQGALGSGHYIPFVRPAGLGKLWYMYDSCQVRCLTQKGARFMFDGVDRQAHKSKINHYFPHQAHSSSKRQDQGLAYLAWYLREDYSVSAFTTEQEEPSPPPDLATRKSPRRDTKSVRKPQAEPKWSVKDNPVLDISPLSAIRSTLNNNISTNSSNGFNDPSDPGDIIMSDTEEDYAQQVLLARTLHGTASSNHTPIPARGETEQTTKKVFSFFSGEFYSGDVRADDVYHGQGWLIRTNGDEYHGSFQNGSPHGDGTMVYSKSGDKYTGKWLDGQHHGHGKLTEKSTGNVYEGGWKEGRRHGAFFLRGVVTEDDKHYCQICYENTINTAFFDCGHALACKQCAKVLTTCPVCRKTVTARLELFGVKVSMQ